MIKIEHLSKNYGSTQVLKDISVEFEEGKVYGIVGKNGAGKTTLFNCISGLESYQGLITSQYDQLKNHLGLLQTDPSFMSRITGWEYLKLLCVARGMSEEQFDRQNIFDLPLHRFAETYSTGMKKKLALMGVILQKNEVYILDEPFNGVDIQSNIMIVELIHRLKAQGKTILISSHVFSTLRETCDSIFLIEAGHLKPQVRKEEYDSLEADMKADIITADLDLLEI